MASHPKIRRAANLALFAYAPIIFAFYGFFVAVGRMSWLTMGWPLFIAAAGAVGRYATRDSLKAVERAPAAPRWELKAPNPAQGQCPVCGLTDLAERAVGDELLGDAGTALARVVAYGPDRAHAECAAVVSYVPPPRSTSGGTAPGYHAAANPDGCSAPRCRPCAAKPGRLRESFIEAMAEEAVALGEKLQREMGLQPTALPGRLDELKPPYLTRAGTYRASCAYCPWTQQLGTEGAGYLAVREHAHTCLARIGVKAGKKPPDGWRQVGSLLAAIEPTASRDPLIQVAADIMSRVRDYEPGGMLLLTDPGGRVVEGGQILESSYPDGGALLVHARIAGPLRKAHPHLAGVWVRVRT